jgi:cytochrome c peroxidase
MPTFGWPRPMFRHAHGLALGTAFVGLAIAVVAATRTQVHERRIGLPQPTVSIVGSSPDEPLSSLPLDAPEQTARTRLGALLFADARLSQHGRVSCSSCHDLTANGATGARVDRGDDGTSMAINTPTVFNSSLNFRRNWEGWPHTVTELVARTFRMGSLMGWTPAPGLHRLQLDQSMRAKFSAIYGRSPDEAAVNDALVSFMATLITPGARFDRWLRGDASALSTQERRGYARFKAVGCASCHQGVNVGGNLLERHGIYHPLATGRPQLLRVPSLRNVAVTGPYFHDGSALKLPVAVRSMGRAQLDVLLDTPDAEDIAAFLATLTGRYRNRDLKAPRPGSTR